MECLTSFYFSCTRTPSALGYVCYPYLKHQVEVTPSRIFSLLLFLFDFLPPHLPLTFFLSFFSLPPLFSILLSLLFYLSPPLLPFVSYSVSRFSFLPLFNSPNFCIFALVCYITFSTVYLLYLLIVQMFIFLCYFSSTFFLKGKFLISGEIQDLCNCGNLSCLCFLGRSTASCCIFIIQ